MLIDPLKGKPTHTVCIQNERRATTLICLLINQITIFTVTIYLHTFSDFLRTALCHLTAAPRRFRPGVKTNQFPLQYRWAFLPRACLSLALPHGAASVGFRWLIIYSHAGPFTSVRLPPRWCRSWVITVTAAGPNRINKRCRTENSRYWLCRRQRIVAVLGNCAPI